MLVVDLGFLVAIGPARTDTFSVLIVKNFNGIAVGDGDDRAGEVGSG